jgi:hypothetical protein
MAVVVQPAPSHEATVCSQQLQLLPYEVPRAAATGAGPVTAGCPGRRRGSGAARRASAGRTRRGPRAVQRRGWVGPSRGAGTHQAHLGLLCEHSARWAAQGTRRDPSGSSPESRPARRRIHRPEGVRRRLQGNAGHRCEERPSHRIAREQCDPSLSCIGRDWTHSGHTRVAECPPKPDAVPSSRRSLRERGAGRSRGCARYAAFRALVRPIHPRGDASSVPPARAQACYRRRS